MQTSTQFEEAVKLLQAASFGIASEADIERLNELLRASAELRVEIARHLHDEVLLREELAVHEANDLANHENLVSLVKLDEQNAGQNIGQNTGGPFPAMSLTNWTVGVACLGLIAAACFATFIQSSPSESEWGHQMAREEGGQMASPAKAFQESEVLGTLTFADDCVWDEKLQLGEQLFPGKIKLHSGLARVSLVNGVVLIIEGSAGLNLKSPDHVLVDHGNVLARVSEQAIGFRLETPTTIVVDVGTEFYVSVDSAGHSAVEVVEGAVTCLPHKGSARPNSPLLTAGSPTLFESREDRTGRAGTSRAKRFRELCKIVELASPSDELLAFEDYQYPIGQVGEKAGGSGWLSPWKLGHKSDKPTNFVVREGQNLQIPAWFRGDASRYCVQPTGSLSRRILANPIDLSVDADYFISFPMRKRSVGPIGSLKTGSGISIRSADDLALGMGMSLDYHEKFTSWTGADRYSGGTDALPDTPYLVVVKIAARQNDPDNMMICVLQEGSPIKITEPVDWDCVGKPAMLDGQLDTFVTWSDYLAITMFGELRVGRTWSSVLPLR